MVTEVYLDEVLDDPVPYEEAELAAATPSTLSEVESVPPSSAPATPASAQVRACGWSGCGSRSPLVSGQRRVWYGSFRVLLLRVVGVLEAAAALAYTNPY